MLDIDQVGDRLFGRRARLRVAAWVVAREEPFFQGEVAAAIGLAQSNVREELDRLMELQMVTSFPQGAGDRRRYYAKADSPLWTTVEAAVAAVDELARRAAASRRERKAPS